MAHMYDRLDAGDQGEIPVICGYRGCYSEATKRMVLDGEWHNFCAPHHRVTMAWLAGPKD